MPVPALGLGAAPLAPGDGAAPAAAGLPDGDVDADGDGEGDGEGDALGDAAGDPDAPGDPDGPGEPDGAVDADAPGEPDGPGVGDARGAAIAATLVRISMKPVPVWVTLPSIPCWSRTALHLIGRHVRVRELDGPDRAAREVDRELEARPWD